MLTVEMHRSFLLKVHSLDRTDIRDVQSYDVLFYLNQAQDIFIDKAIAEKNLEIIRPITDSQSVAHAAFVSTTGTYVTGITGAEAVDLSALTTFRTYLRSQSVVTRTAVPACTSVSVANKPIDALEVYQWETNGTNKPIFTNPKEIREGKYLIVIADGFTSIESIEIVYVKTPTVLVLSTPASDTCDLPAHVHQSIVDLAVQLSAETINVSDARKK